MDALVYRGCKKVKTHRDGKIVAAGELRDLADVPEAGAHDDGLVAVLLVVVVDGVHALDARVVLRRVPFLLLVRLIPVQDAAHEGRDQEGARLGGRDGLRQREHERQVAVDPVLGLQRLRRLDALPRRGDLDQDALLFDADGLVELWEVGFSLVVE